MHIIIAHFGAYFVDCPGGVEKVTCELANALADRGHQVTILYTDKQEGKPYFPLSDKVQTHNILYMDGRLVESNKLPVHLRIYREGVRLFSQAGAQAVNAEFKGKRYGVHIREFLAVHPVDLIISCSVQSTAYVVNHAGCTVPVIQMIHSHPDTLFPALSGAEKKAVEKCRAMQILLPSGLETARQYFPHLPIRVIGNAVFPAVKMATAGEPKSRYLISCVGNLTHNKRQKLLCEAFGLLAAEYPDWDLELWGWSGKYGRDIESWAQKHNLSGRLFLKGETADVGDVYARSDIFCLPSRAEGFGLSLAEAMAAGVPGVGFKGCTGVEDLIQDGISGLLADNGNIQSLAEKLKSLMDYPDMRRKFGLQAREQMKKYAPEKIWEEWESFLQEVIAG